VISRAWPQNKGPVPATGSEGHGDDVGLQFSELHRRGDLAPAATGVAHVDDIDAHLATGDGGHECAGPEATQPSVTESP